MTDEPISRFPLAWPSGWKRTPSHQRQRASFSASSKQQIAVGDNQIGVVRRTRALTVADALRRLTGELGRLGVTHEVLSTNVAVRLDGLPRSGQGEPTDPGAAVYFRLKNKPLCLACDRWTRVADNIAAIAQHIDALRRIDRYGIGTMEQAFAGYTALPPDAATDWWIILGVTADAPIDVIEKAFRDKAMLAHPDRGGRLEDMARLNTARDAARRARVTV